MTPPRLAIALLSRVLASDPARPAILGDLLEDFVQLCRSRGEATARRWYWREALLLTGGRLTHPRRRSRTRHPTMNRSAPFGSIVQDSSFAFRSLRRAPGFALFTAAVIGLGVGAATTVFSVTKPLMLEPLPFSDPGRLVWIARSDGPSLSSVTSRAANLRDFRRLTKSFVGLTGYNAFSQQTAFTLTGSGEPTRLVGYAVAHDFLSVLGVRPLHGGGFTAEEGLWGGPPAVILSYGFWRNRFDADPGVVGRSITLNDVPRTVVGVLPPAFDFSSVFTPGARVDFLLPYPVSDETDNHGNELFIIGRLRDGVSPGAAQADLDAVMAGLRRQEPDRWGLGAIVTPLQEHLAGPFFSAFLLLFAAAGTLLLMVCVNVSNLLLARAPARAREAAVRKALGGTRGRLARQFVLEVVGIALVGACFGGGIAWLATHFVSGTAALRIPLLNSVRVDLPTLGFGAAVALASGLLVSIVPALQVTEGEEASVLRASGRGGTSGRGPRRFRDMLVVSEVALACVLLVFSGLLVRSFRSLLGVDLGFDPENAVAWQINPSQEFGSFTERSGFFATVSERIAQVPGVEEAGLIDALPLGRNRTWNLRLAGTPEEREYMKGFFPHIVGPGYLPTMHIPLVSGRNFTRSDVFEGKKVVLINETAAAHIFDGQEALGSRIVSSDLEWEVVGIVKDVRHVSPESGSGPEVYFPMTQMWDYRTMDLVVRSRLPTEQVAGAVASALREIDAAMPVREFWTLESTVDRALSPRRFTLGVIIAYGAVALLLATLGIYGVLAQSVAERKDEIGIRVALGASEADVIRSVIGKILFLTGAGIVIGALASAWAGRLAASLLFRVKPTDPVTFVGMAVILMLVAALAGWMPARTAAHIRGTRALRDP